MGDIFVYISGEDQVTKAVIERVLNFCSPSYKILKEIPARGGEIKKKIPELNKLSASSPVILLTDLDASSCAPLLKKDLLKEMEQNENFILNIAVDEAEAWLIADTNGFADYFGIPLAELPESRLTKMNGHKDVMEMPFSCKSSWLFTHSYITKSTKRELRLQIEAQGTACKGREYNQAVVPFIKNYWNIEAAMANSNSLERMVIRLRSLSERLSVDHAPEIG